jgi:preprotein translocase subunit Sec63
MAVRAVECYWLGRFREERNTSMETDEALEVLGIKESDRNDELVRMRYQRLIRRYPPDIFPEMAIRVRHAYELLTQSPADEYIKYLVEDRVNIAALERAIPETPASEKADLDYLLRSIIEVWCENNTQKHQHSNMSELMLELRKLIDADFDLFNSL